MELVKLILNGTTKFSIMVSRLIEYEGLAQVVAFTTKKCFIEEPFIDGKEVVPFEDLNCRFDNKSYKILNTIGYSKMNTIRERVNVEIEDLGFIPFSYISKKAFIMPTSYDLVSLGCIIMPNVFLGTNVQIGKSSVVYSNCSLTHDIIIGNHVF